MSVIPHDKEFQLYCPLGTGLFAKAAVCAILWSLDDHCPMFELQNALGAYLGTQPAEGTAIQYDVVIFPGQCHGQILYFLVFIIGFRRTA